MASKGKRVYKLAEYTVERRESGWYFGISAHFGEKEAMHGPYASISSVTLVIARQLKREIATRDAPHAAKA